MNLSDKNAVYDLIKEAQSGSTYAKEKLVSENLGLAMKIAGKFYSRGYDTADINQLATLGLLRAIDNFDISHGVMFSTYAVPVIMGEIRRFLRDDGPIKISRSTKEISMKVARFIENEIKEKGTTPKISEIAASISHTVEEIIEAQEASIPPHSLNAESPDGASLADILKSGDDENSLITRIDIKRAVCALTDREQKIIIMRYFMDKTQSAVAKKLGISQVQVSRLEKKILTKLKNILMCEN